MHFGLLFFSGLDERNSRQFEAILRASALADDAGLRFVSVPERHFDPFGGLFPNPAVVAAAIAARTQKIQVRSGSVIAPLHDVLRIAEEWAIVDRISNGRVALSIGSGWNVNDFVLAANAFADRRRIAEQQIDALQRLWSGESVALRNGAGEIAEVSTFPRPVQPRLPLWITSSSSLETWEFAARIGANILTHTENQDLEGLEAKIKSYRRATGARAGIVTVMQHTFIHENEQEIDKAREALRSYIVRALELERRAVSGGGEMSGRKRVSERALSKANLSAVTDLAAKKYTTMLGLIGTVDDCTRRAEALRAVGVDEIACLVDFVDPDLLLVGIPGLIALANRMNAGSYAHNEASVRANWRSVDDG